MRKARASRFSRLRLAEIALCSCVLVPNSLAETHSDEPLSLRDAIQTALLHNRTLQIELERGVSPNDMIGLVFTMPLSRTADRANFRAGKELKKQAELLVKQKEEMVAREISDAIHFARFSLDRARSARRTTEYAEAALKAEEEKLAGGKSSIIFVLAFQTDLATAQATELQAKCDYNKAVSQVHFAEGSILQRNKVEFEFR